MKSKKKGRRADAEIKGYEAQQRQLNQEIVAIREQARVEVNKRILEIAKLEGKIEKCREDKERQVKKGAGKEKQ